MANPTLTIDLNAAVSNWQALDALSGTSVETAAVVKANAYGLGVSELSKAMSGAGVKSFFVASCEEGAQLRQAIGDRAWIGVFSGHMEGDLSLISQYNLSPMLNSKEQITRHFKTLPNAAFGVQLDTGMNRLGLEPAEWHDLKSELLAKKPELVMSHLSCADTSDHSMNRQQLQVFKALTDGIETRRSLSATGGILLGSEYHFDLTRPGIGLYGGLPFAGAAPVVHTNIPIIQIRDVEIGETVGYSNTWTAQRPSRVATIACGYADGVTRHISNKAHLFHKQTPCPLLGRVSMDMIAVDVTDLQTEPHSLDLLCAHQSVDQIADIAGTIGYEILTSLGPRYNRHYKL